MTRRSLIAAGAATWASMQLRESYAADSLTGTTVGVATYGGSWKDSIVKFVLPDLIKRGVKFDFTLGVPDDNLARLIAAKRQGQAPFDTIDPSALSYQSALRAGFFAPIDYKQLSNAHLIPDWAREDRQLTALFTVDGIVYNTEKLAAAGAAAPTSYTGLGDPKLKGHVAFPDPAHPQHWNAVVSIARELGGSEANLAGVIDRVNKIAPAYFYTSSVDLASRMSRGEIWAAAWHGGWAVRLKRTGVPAATTYVKIGDTVGAVWPSTRAIVAGAKNMAGAHAYLDAWLDVDGPAKFADDTGSVPINPQARAKMAESPDNRAMLLLTDDELAKTYRTDWSRINDREWRDQWNRGIAR